MNNPLLHKTQTLHDTPAFDLIKNEHFIPAFHEAIKAAKADIKFIENNEEAPTFENTIEALEFAGMQLDRISSIFFNLNSAETNEEIQKIAQEISPLLTDFGNDINLSEKLFGRIKIVFENTNQKELCEEKKTLLNQRYKSFVRNGALLNESDKEQLRTIDKELAKTKLTFGENVLASSNAFELWIDHENDLDGLPKQAIATAKMMAEQKGKKDQWLITLDYPSYIPFMTYANNRDLRKKLALAFGQRAFGDNEFDNRKHIQKIVSLRHKRAELLGYESHAHFVLEERMAETPENVMNFLDDLKSKSMPFANKEFKELQSFAEKTDGIKDFQSWDGAYYTEKLKQEKFDFDEEALKPFLPLEQCEKGMFYLAETLFDLKFELQENITTYHQDVNAYEVFNKDGEFVSVFYTDYFPRPGKRQGAWMTSYKNQWKKNGENSRPHVSIVCNFTPPTGETPSLLTFNEFTTLFHEFGHALHGMLANTEYPSLSGTNVFWDFVELPSQMLENWCYEKEMLDKIAFHYQTKEPIPFDLVEKIKESATFMEGMKTVRQLSFGFLDMTWHFLKPENKTVEEIEKEAFSSTQLYPYNSKTLMSTAFSHIFQGGYSSGYYSYKWAEVLDADAFEFFKEKGIFNKDVSQLFKENILEKGGTEPPMTLYKRFRGQEPSSVALLKRAGLQEK
ncbi:MAG: M3 family metallopeptidase [Flavobacteriales bacterium]|jgi:peptidyl-dipeptidase Dcp|nr:M3 family metallopeptidase [Flavobacteriales bacterium]